MSHMLLMAIYAALLGVFFATLSRRDLKSQVKLFVTIFGGLMIGAMALGWLMYFFPSGPPAPIP